MKITDKFLILMMLSSPLLTSCHRGGKRRFVRRTAFIMGTVINVDVPAESAWAADTAIEAFRLVDSLMSPLKDSSDLSRINGNAGRWVRVSPLTAECIRYALQIGELSGGAFDITAGALVHLWHFDTEKGWVEPSKSSIDSASKFVDFRKIEVNDDSVRIGRGQRIDLGGIAKGYAIDLAVERLKRLGIRNALIDAGGDIYALGNGPHGKWRIGIRDPFNRGNIMGILALSDKSVCTSGDYERFIKVNGVRYSHIFDPRTGWPVRGVVSVTVIGPISTMSDGLATAVFVLGPKKGLKLINSLDGYETMIVTESDTLFSPGFRNYLVSGEF